MRLTEQGALNQSFQASCPKSNIDHVSSKICASLYSQRIWSFILALHAWLSASSAFKQRSIFNHSHARESPISKACAKIADQRCRVTCVQPSWCAGKLTNSLLPSSQWTSCVLGEGSLSKLFTVPFGDALLFLSFPSSVSLWAFCNGQSMRPRMQPTSHHSQQHVLAHRAGNPFSGL